MRNLRRSVSSYLSSDRSKSQLFQRNYSVPYGFSYNEADDNDIVDGAECVVRGQTLPLKVLECLVDAHGEFSEIYKAVVTPNGNFQPRLSDAVILLPNIAFLVTDNKPDALPTVYDVLTRIQQELPNLQQQNIQAALKEIQNAIVLLNKAEDDHATVDIDLSQPRDIMAAVMIVNKYLTNVTQSSNSAHISY